MQKYKTIVGYTVILIALLLTGILNFSYQKNFYFAGETVRDAKMLGSGTEYVLKDTERKELTQILRKLQTEKLNTSNDKVVLHSSRCFQVETTHAVSEITLYGNVRNDLLSKDKLELNEENYLCAINKELYRISESSYYELDNLYHECFQSVHKELFTGFQNSKIVSVTHGIGMFEKVFSEAEKAETLEILQSMKILGKAEERPQDLVFGSTGLVIETEQDTIYISYFLPYDDEKAECCINGSSYWVDKKSADRFYDIIHSDMMIENE